MTGAQVIEAYLAQVAAALPGPARARRDVVAELRSGLLDAADAYHRAGLPEVTAAEAAVGEFGDPRQVAAAFRPELTARHVRQLTSLLAAASVPVGLLWAHAAQASHPAISRAPLGRWIGEPPVPLAAAAFLIAALVALGTIAITGHLTRWLPGGPRSAAVSGGHRRIRSGGCGYGDLHPARSPARHRARYARSPSRRYGGQRKSRPPCILRASRAALPDRPGRAHWT